MSGAETRVVIAGGGVAGLEAALAVRQLAADASVELITGDASFAYRQLSVLEPFTDAKTVRVSYDALRARGITVTQGLLSRVDCPNDACRWRLARGSGSLPARGRAAPGCRTSANVLDTLPTRLQASRESPGCTR
jgi:hypothetical protein